MAIKWQGLITLSTLTLQLFLFTTLSQAETTLNILSPTLCNYGLITEVDANEDGVNDPICARSGVGLTVYNGIAVKNGIHGSAAILRTHSNTTSGYGKNLTAVGDLDGDNVEDYSVTHAGLGTHTQGYTVYETKLYIYSGKTGNLLTTLENNEVSTPYRAFRIGKGQSGRERLAIPHRRRTLIDTDSGPQTVKGMETFIYEWNPNNNELVYDDWIRIDNPSPYIDVKWMVGFQIMSAGIDITGDGIDEFIVTDPLYSPLYSDQNENFGRIMFINGRTLKNLNPIIQGNNNNPILGDNIGDHLGKSIKRIQDLNGDGIGEIAVGAPGNNLVTHQGYVRIYNGADLAVIGTISQAGTKFFGEQIISVDLNGDNKKELGVTSLNPSGGNGQVYFYEISLIAGSSLQATVLHQEIFNGNVATIDYSYPKIHQPGILSGLENGYDNYSLHASYVSNYKVQLGESYGCDNNLTTLSGVPSLGNGGLIASLSIAAGCATNNGNIAVEVSNIDHNYATTVLHSASTLASHTQEIGPDVIVYPARNASYTQTVVENLAGPSGSIILRNIQTEEIGNTGVGSLFMQVIRFGQLNPNTSNPNSSMATSLPYSLTIEVE